jgi:CBS domain-containing protein
MSLLEIKSFIRNIKPFDNLLNNELEEICSHLDIVYFKNNEQILSPVKNAEFLYFVIKGVIQEKLNDEVVSVYSANEYFDPITLIENKIKHTFITVQESILYALPKEIFLKYMYQNRALESYFFSTISQKLNNSMQNEEKKKLLDFAMSKVEDAYLQKPIYIDERETIYGAVVQLTSNNIQSILVKRADGEIGIVTDSSFVKKVALKRMDLDGPVSQITTYGLKYIEATDFLFNAQIQMAKYNLKRLVVKKEGEIIGILDIVSLSSFFASHTHSTSMLIEEAKTVDELKEASSKFIRTIRVLYEKGVKVRYISKLISQLNEKLFEKLFELTAPQELKIKSTLIIMGSEGRSEQILRTDQDNALILADDCSMSYDDIMEYTQTFTEHLVAFGYPLCDGNIMVSNPFWVQNITKFKETIFNWIHKPSEENYMNLAIFYDAVAITGDKNLLVKLKEYLFVICDNAPSFYPFFAKPIISFETPLGLFSDFVVDKTLHKDELDIKKGGIFPIVHGVRTLSIEKKLEETNTVDRLKYLRELGVLDEEFTNEIIESFNFLLTLR